MKVNSLHTDVKPQNQAKDLEEYTKTRSLITMNSILVCLFVFTVGSLAAKIPKDVDKGETPEANTESLLKRNLDFSDPCRDTSLIIAQKQALGNQVRNIF